MQNDIRMLEEIFDAPPAARGGSGRDVEAILDRTGGEALSIHYKKGNPSPSPPPTLASIDEVHPSLLQHITNFAFFTAFALFAVGCVTGWQLLTVFLEKRDFEAKQQEIALLSQKIVDLENEIQSTSVEINGKTWSNPEMSEVLVTKQLNLKEQIKGDLCQ